MKAAPRHRGKPVDGQRRVGLYRRTMNSQAPSMEFVYAFLAVLSIIVAGFWIMFPLLVYDQLKKIRKAINE